MPLRVLLVGPGRVGCAFARALLEHGVEVIGLVGRDPARAAAAAASLGVPMVPAAAHANAHVVLFAVGDAELPAAASAVLAAAAPRRCSLWLHTSGRHDLGVFGPAAGRRLGSLHPVVPFPDAERGRAAMVGAPGVVHGEGRALPLLQRLCRRLSLVPVVVPACDRAVYHAACALAANGATALWEQVVRTFRRSGVGDDAAPMLARALFEAAIRACAQSGATAALSGPVRRGDAETVQRHRAALAVDPATTATYVALMQEALQLAARAGLASGRAAAVASVLRANDPA